MPHSYKRLRCVALIRHRAWLRQSRFVNASAGDADEGENLRVPLNATGSTAPKGPPGGRTWSHFERVRLESLAKDAEDAIGRAEEKADETGERGDPRLASARAQIRMAAGDVVGAREVLEDLAAREDMRGCLAAQTMLADLLDEIKAASNPPERSVAENPGSERAATRIRAATQIRAATRTTQRLGFEQQRGERRRARRAPPAPRRRSGRARDG